ncbi:MAG: sialidase family protein [Pirellulales bacterium]
MCLHRSMYVAELYRTLFLLTFTINLSVCCAVSPIGAEEPYFEQQTIFSAGEHGVSLYRIPGIVVTTKGTILAYCEARRNSSADWGEIEVHLRRSTDGGKTWSDPLHIAHKGPRIEGNPKKKTGGEHEQTVNNPVAIVDRQSGNLEMLYCLNYARCFSMRSTDDGLTWSEPREITGSFEPFKKHYPWTVIATGPGHGIQLKSGRLLVPIWLAYGSGGAHSPSAAATIYSDDHGETWHAGDIAVPNMPPLGNPNESIAAERSDGTVMLISRSESKPNRKIVTSSIDGASLWSRPHFEDALWEPICMSGLVSDPKSGVFFFTNPHSLAKREDGQEIPAGRGKRKNLTVKLSTDDGKSWTASRTIEPGPSAYSDLSLLPSGQIACFYEADKELRVARFNQEWIKVGDGAASR